MANELDDKQDDTLGQALQDLNPTPQSQWLANYKAQQSPQQTWLDRVRQQGTPLPSDRSLASAREQTPLSKEQTAPAINDIVSGLERRLPDVYPEPDKQTEEKPSEAASASVSPELMKKARNNVGVDQLSPNIANLLKQQSSYQDQLKDAQDARDKAQLIANLGKAGVNLGASIARVKPEETSVLDAMAKQAESIPKDLEERMTMDEKDPNSQYSKDLRTTIKKATGYDVPESASAKNIKDSGLFKELTSISELKYKTQALAESKRQHDETMKLAIGQKREEKLDLQDRKDLDKMGKEASALTASSRSALGASGVARTRALRLKELLSDPNTTPEDMRNAAAEMHVIVTNTSTEVGAKGQEYNNLATKWAELQQQLGSGIVPVQIPEIKKHMAEVTDRMIKISDDVQRQHLGTIQKRYADLFKRRPDDAGAVIDSIINPQGGMPGVNSAQTSSGKVKVSNGKETLMIDPSDLEHAKSDGYSQVK